MNIENIATTANLMAGMEFLLGHRTVLSDKTSGLRFIISGGLVELKYNDFSSFVVGTTGEESPGDLAARMTLLAGLVVKARRDAPIVYKDTYDVLKEKEVFPVVTRLSSGIMAVKILANGDFEQIKLLFDEMQRRNDTFARRN